MSYRQLLEQVQNQVQALFTTANKPELLYHNLEHTQSVVAAATQIANHYQLSDRDFFVVVAAAWFHDVGYLNGDAKGHEEKGAEEAATFLSGLQVNADDILAVKQCILATRMPQQPNGLLEQIICDADLFHLGAADFAEKSKVLRKEIKVLYGKDLSKEEWRAKTIGLLQGHHYFTDYSRTLLEPKKRENLAALLAKQLEDAHQGDGNKKEKETAIAPTTEANSDTVKKKNDRPERGIETMFRISSSNHQRLSDMADNKSHIIITVNSIIISVVVSLLLRKLDTNDYLTIPAMMLLVVSLVAIVLSILAARPNIPNGTFTKNDLDEKKVNLLFFGNFYNMSLESYTEGMIKVMDDRDFLYRSLIRDVYSQGVVLGRKYKLLRASYNVFMFGLIASVIAFIIASLLTTNSIL
jgi:predicted metal-dependent HD superfamily phosphohydrolase